MSLYTDTKSKGICFIFFTSGLANMMLNAVFLTAVKGTNCLFSRWGITTPNHQFHSRMFWQLLNFWVPRWFVSETYVCARGVDTVSHSPQELQQRPLILYTPPAWLQRSALFIWHLALSLFWKTAACDPALWGKPWQNMNMRNQQRMKSFALAVF